MTKVITINKDRFAGTDIHNTKSNGKSLFDIQQEMNHSQWLIDNGKFNSEDYNKGE